MTEPIKVKGLADLQKMLNTLPAKMGKNILRGAMRAGAKPVLAAAKQEAAVVSGELRDSLKITGGAKKGNRGQVHAAVKTDKFYAKFVEFGTDPHEIHPKNREALAVDGKAVELINHPGAKPHPFMRPALDTQAGAAVTAAGEYIKKRLTKAGLDASGVDVGVEE